MSRLLEFQPSEESVIVSRILVQVHKAVDEDFPNAAPPPRRFAKTLFTENDETTQNKPLPTDIVLPPPPNLAERGSRSGEDVSPFAVTKDQMPITAPNQKVSASGRNERRSAPPPPPTGASTPHSKVLDSPEAGAAGPFHKTVSDLIDLSSGSSMKMGRVILMILVALVLAAAAYLYGDVIGISF